MVSQTIATRRKCECKLAFHVERRSQFLIVGIRGEAYAHEQIQVPQGTAREFLEIVADEAVRAYEPLGWKLAGAWETAMVNETECFLLWAIPTWEQWAESELAERRSGPLKDWRARTYELSNHWHRFLLVDSPLSPMRTGRQPSRADRNEGWEDL